MLQSTNFDAVVIGAGPAGSAAAILLARAGWTVALVERQTFPRRKVCGECIAASNLPLLEALGLGDALAASAGPVLRRVTLMRGEREVSARLPLGVNPAHPWGRALGRETLDTLLLEQARKVGAAVMQPWSVQAMVGKAGAWQCKVRSGADGRTRVLHSTVLIDAHGSWEPMAARGRAARRPSDLFGFKANFHASAHRESDIGVLALDGGYGGMVVADGGVTTVACCIRRDRLDALRRSSEGQSAGEVVQAWLRAECAGVQRALSDATRDGPWLAAGPIRPGVRVGLHNKLFRIGNAAGEAHPILGEGMSMALQSAAMLCAHLLEGDAPGSSRNLDQARALRNYVADWQRSFAPRLRLAAAFAHVALRPSTSGALMALLRGWPGLLTQGARWGGKVDYPQLGTP
jgi:flavin-dependent dehydrogenase